MVYHVGDSIRTRGGDGPPTPGGGARLLNRNQKATVRHQRVELALGVLDELAILLAAPTPLPAVTTSCSSPKNRLSLRSRFSSSN